MRGALFRDVTIARRRAKRMEAVLINLCTEIYYCLGASKSCRSMIQSAVNSLLGTFTSTLYEASGANVMSLRGDNDLNVNSVMAVVHRQLLRVRDTVDAMRTRSQLPSVTYPPESDSGADDPGASPALRLRILLFQ